MTSDDTTKKAALSLLRRGMVSQSEAARLAGISRQLMRHWAREIDVEAAREQVLAKLWQRVARR
jgi:predicted HTH domain antitoxin